MRKPLIAANWKMNLNVSESTAFAEEISSHKPSGVDVVIAPSFTNISVVACIFKKNKADIAVAAQNVYFEDSGAYTGEVSVGMIKSAGASAVILGHSERRAIFKEDDAVINRKVHKSVSASLKVILCVGESFDERESGVEIQIVLSQLGKSLMDVKDLSNITIAYEPVWAIGTGKTASPKDAEIMHGAIRDFIAGRYSSKAADELRILYGGSVKPDNIKELMEQTNVDGALVGGASLKADQFIKIINF
jgi:triosephosphate isomerase